jgi:transcriptional regulator with XRE-family HTH domain
MSVLAYQREPWFSMLLDRAQAPGAVRAHIARQLGISPAALSQVLNGSGAYGSGAASTSRIADRVQRTFGRYPCPHLTAESSGDERVITAEQCRAFAHRPAPTASPRDMQHWQACRQCPHREASAPPAPKEPQRRARRTVDKENGDAA